jgi:hypothetical protein
VISASYCEVVLKVQNAIPEDFKANRQEGYCFIMTMPDPVQPEQPRREFKNCSGNFLSITAHTRPLVTSMYFFPLEEHFGGVRFADDEELEAETRKWLRHRKILRCAFRRTGKTMRQTYQCWLRICQEILVHVFRFVCNMLHVLYPFVTYLLTVPRTILGLQESSLMILICDRALHNPLVDDIDIYIYFFFFQAEINLISRHQICVRSCSFLIILPQTWS